MYSCEEYASQAELLRSYALGLEKPVINTLIGVMRGSKTLKAALAQLDKLGDHPEGIKATLKFRRAAAAIRGRKPFSRKTLELQ